jgi:hypothetical protein
VDTKQLQLLHSFGLSKDFSITEATVSTKAAMLPRPQQGLPAVVARRHVAVCLC